MTKAGSTLDTPEIRPCFEGILPASLGSASDDGTPNVMWLSIVHLLDATHVGLSRQYFRKTSQNILVNRRLQLLVIHPVNGRQYHLNLEHERTETEGVPFERMRTKLEGIASQSGMGRVFRLAGLDVCRVVSIDEIPADRKATEQAPPDTAGALHAQLKQFTNEVSAASDVEDLITRSLAALERVFGFPHAMLLLLDETGEHLYTVGSNGYASSGAGSEVKVGEGHIGVVAERRQSILTANIAMDHAYADAVRRSTTRSGQAHDLSREIPLPGLPDAMSQLAVPISALGRLLGVLCLQSRTPGFFRVDHEDMVNVAATQMGMAMSLLRLAPTVDASPWRIGAPPAESPSVEVKHFVSDDSILIDNEYLIKGVAGRILWRILQHHAESHRVEFSNKEIRLDQTMGLPGLNDNLESRLILLRRRLEERCKFIQIATAGRGRFRLNVFRPLSLEELP
jgi:adenylate cyclase